MELIASYTGLEGETTSIYFDEPSMYCLRGGNDFEGSIYELIKHLSKSFTLKCIFSLVKQLESFINDS